MSQAQPPRPITGRMVFFMLVAFFGVVIGVNAHHDAACDPDLARHRVDSAYAPALPTEGDRHRARPGARATGRSMPMSSAADGAAHAAGRGARQ